MRGDLPASGRGLAHEYVTNKPQRTSGGEANRGSKAGTLRTFHVIEGPNTRDQIT